MEVVDHVHLKPMVEELMEFLNSHTHTYIYNYNEVPFCIFKINNIFYL